ncbi:MAG: leucyl aminopeptidase [Desulfobulbaceae bacterium]
MIKLTERKPEDVRADLLVCFVGESGKKNPECFSVAVRSALMPAWRAGDFVGREGQTFLFYPPVRGKRKEEAEEIRSKRVLVVGLGKNSEKLGAERERIRAACGTAAGQARKLKAKRVLVVLPEATSLRPEDTAECLAEGLILGNYLFAKYKKSRENDEVPFAVQDFLTAAPGVSPKPVRKGLRRGTRAAQAACAARDMALEPGSSWTALQFAAYGKKLARRTGLRCTVLGKEEMKKLGMGGILAVNRGSAVPPRLVVLEYRAGAGCPTLMLVGKGLTFDSGGVSLKPAAGMEDMKYDMCGGAAVLAAMEAVAQERPAGLNVVALVPATDNMSGSNAVKPGDIITQYNGITVEVVNTDAEGRLLLADALSYGVKKFKPDAVIDLATLTGAVIVGLGHHRTGLFANNDTLAERIFSAGELCGEPLWRLPLGPEYTKQLKSEVADLKNIGGKGGGTITAAAFLEKFVGDTPWAHLDIAGTAWNFTEKSYIPAKGPSGVGVRILLTLIRAWKPLK